jgi:lysophospholipase L1-like esterase
MPHPSRPVPARLARLATLALLVLTPWSAPVRGQAVAPAVKPAPSSSSERWEKDIHAFVEMDKSTPPPKGAVLFIGASSTRRWTTLAQDFPEYPVINRGFGGSQIADSTYYADQIVIPYRPRLIVFQAGGNDINAGKKAERVLEDFKAFVAKVRAEVPEVRIAFTGINPSPRRWEQAEEQQKTNRLVREYVRAGKNLDFIELWDQFLGPDGKPREDLFVEDRLHNNAAGYKIRAAVVRPHLQ